MSANMTHDLLEWLQEDVKIAKLSLVNCNLSAMSLTHPEAESDDKQGYLNEFIESSSYLVELDISYNEIPPDHMIKLTDSFCQNGKLQYLNLSHNNLTYNSTFKDKIDRLNLKTPEGYDPTIPARAQPSV